MRHEVIFEIIYSLIVSSCFISGDQSHLRKVPQ